MRLTTYRNLPYPMNLWSTVFRRECSRKELPWDWEDTLVDIFATLGNSQRGDIILHYFKNRLTMDKIGEIYGVTRENIRQNLNKTISILRKESKKQIMGYGIHRVQEMRKQRTNYWIGKEQAENDTVQSIFEMKVSELDISVRASNALCQANICTVRELIARTEEELLMYRALGENCIKEIKKALAQYNLTLNR